MAQGSNVAAHIAYDDLREWLALAERLGTPLVEFPGGHGGFSSDPEDFAAVLRRTLA